MWYHCGMGTTPPRQSARRGLEAGGGADPRLLIRAVRLARSVEQGRHGTGERGDSTEFFDHRPYETGDPLSTVDWRLYGRTDRHYVRRFRHDARLTVTVALDASASMDFTGLPGARSGVSVLERGVELGAATLALGARQGDRVGALVVGEDRGGVRRVPAAPGRGGLVRAVGMLGVTRPGGIGALAGTDPSSAGPLARAIGQVLDGGDAPARRGVIVLIGDGYEPLGALGRALAMARACGASVVVLRVLAPGGVAGATVERTTYVDPETGVRVRGGEAASRGLRAHTLGLERVARRVGVRVVDAPTDADPAVALRDAFARRLR
ncbi:MAG: hypothetical protein Tsb0013_01730 [Phycisphaerales bacterium]